MRRLLLYLICGSLTFLLGVAVASIEFSYDREEMLPGPAPVAPPVMEKPAASAEDPLIGVGFRHIGAEKEYLVGGKCVSVQKYLSSDGVEILYQEESYPSVAQAEAGFRKALVGEQKVIELKPVMNDRGVKLGELATIWAPSDSGGAGVASVLMWSGKELCRRKSRSPKHLLLFVGSYVPDTFTDACR